MSTCTTAERLKQLKPWKKNRCKEGQTNRNSQNRPVREIKKATGRSKVQTMRKQMRTMRGTKLPDNTKHICPGRAAECRTCKRRT